VTPNNSLTAFYLKPDDLGKILMTLQNCTIWSFKTAVAAYTGTDLTVDHCVISGNNNAIELGYATSLTVRNSDLRNNPSGDILRMNEQTIDANPVPAKIDVDQATKRDQTTNQFDAN
jgi:Right handed beta helix region